MAQESSSLPEQIKEAEELFKKMKLEIAKAVVGQSQLVEALLIGILSNGHLLLEGVPGVAKTLAANTVAKALDCEFKRVQFTPDLLPADLVGTMIYNQKEAVFEVKKGPIFTHILLADEINRAPSKVQSALLEIMQEKQVTIGGETFQAPAPFFVIATQNPIEQEGTYPLSEAQTDRFLLKVRVDYPSYAEEKMILHKMGNMASPAVIHPILTMPALLDLRRLVDAVYLDDKVVDYLLAIIMATRDPQKFQVPIEGLLEYGASPRATIGLKQASKAKALLSGRYFVTPQDIKEVAPAVLRHRIRLSYEAEAENMKADDLIATLLQTIPVP